MVEQSLRLRAANATSDWRLAASSDPSACICVICGPCLAMRSTTFQRHERAKKHTRAAFRVPRAKIEASVDSLQFLGH